MFLLYLQAFCRIAIGFVFTVSFFGKLFHLSTFQRTILAFNILPSRFSRIAGLLFLLGEGAVVLLIVYGGSLLEPGFLLATLLLLVFTCAIISVLVRKIQTSCNCLGPAEEQVSPTNIWRNGSFILCALGGLSIVAVAGNDQAHIDIAIWGLAGVNAAIFVLIMMQFGEITQLFHNS